MSLKGGLKPTFAFSFGDDLLVTSSPTRYLGDWRAGQRASEVVYKAVFFPRITYALEIWGNAVGTVKAIRLLGTAQQRPLLSIIKVYRTVSTDALQTVAGRLPLDLEVESEVAIKRLRDEDILPDKMDRIRDCVMDK